MKTTLVIPDAVVARLKRKAAEEGRTLSEIVEAALRAYLSEKRRGRTAPEPLPSFDSGGALVDVADRDALYQAMEGR